MRTTFTMILFCYTATFAFGRATDTSKTAKYYTSELGVMLPIANDAGNGHDMALFGMQYRKMLHEHFGYTLLGAWGLYNKWGNDVRQVKGTDSTINKQTTTTCNLAVIGANLYAQRQFYKTVYFTAALEVNAGYGSGNASTSTETSYHYRDSLHHYNHSVYQGGYAIPARLFYLSVAPIAGVKLQLRKISAGFELSTLCIAYQHRTGALASDATDRNNIIGRMVVNYRFR